MASSEHYVWAVDDKPVSVHLGGDAVRQLESRQAESSDSRPHEIGGFLLGRVRQVNESWIVAVDAVEFAVCEHVRGSSWTLSRTDRELFARQMRKLSKKGVVGWFRTHTRPGLYLDEHDFRLFREYFSHPASVALAVRTDGEAGFFIWENGDIERSRPYRTFTCRTEALNFAMRPVRNVKTKTESSPRRRAIGKALLWAPLAAGLALAVFWNPPAPFEPASGERSRVTSERPVFAPPEDTPAPAQRTPSRTPPVARVSKPSAMPPAERREPPALRPISPREPQAIVVAKAETPKPNVLKRAVGSIPGLGFLKRPKAAELDSPAIVTHRVKPERLDDGRPVRVKVKIGKDGYVKSAHLLTTSASAATATAVMRAARAWRFTPARQANHPVESEMVLTFESERRSSL